MGVSFLSLLLALTENLGEFVLLPIPFNPPLASSDRYIVLLEATPDSISMECYVSFYFPNQEGEHPYFLALPLSIEAPSIDLETGGRGEEAFGALGGVASSAILPGAAAHQSRERMAPPLYIL